MQGASQVLAEPWQEDGGLREGVDLSYYLSQAPLDWVNSRTQISRASFQALAGCDKNGCPKCIAEVAVICQGSVVAKVLWLRMVWQVAICRDLL